ncbi:hypothetical protein H9P43_005377 [Blastocladiella emersonii ATCC 22665]|nr:hypothetical protein H9P43_005377 [Blastocladiella emersonii ATCC 22665]
MRSTPPHSPIAAALLATVALALLLGAATPARAAPTWCNRDRSLCLKAAVNGTDVDWTVTFATAGWVSFGLSPSGTMANADVVMVWMQETSKGTAAQVSDRFASGHAVPRVDVKQDWAVVSAAVVDRKNVVTIRRAIDTQEKGADYPFEKKDQQYIWAISKDPVVVSDRAPTFTIHSAYDRFTYNALVPDPPAPAPAPGATAAPADPTKAGSAGAKAPADDVIVDSGMSRDTVILIHAVCMTAAWGFLSYLAIFVARFMKSRLGEWWFRIHWGAMLVLLGLNIAGFVVVFNYVPSGAHFFNTIHGTLGLVVFSAMWLQILLGVAINYLFDPARTAIPIRDRAHWVLGYILAIGGPANIYLGLDLYTPDGWGLKGGYLATWILFIALFGLASVKLKQDNHVNMAPAASSSSISKDAKPPADSGYPMTRRDSGTGTGSRSMHSTAPPSRPRRPVDMTLGELPSPSLSAARLDAGSLPTWDRTPGSTAGSGPRHLGTPSSDIKQPYYNNSGPRSPRGEPPSPRYYGQGPSSPRTESPYGGGGQGREYDRAAPPARSAYDQGYDREYDRATPPARSGYPDREYDRSTPPARSGYPDRDYDWSTPPARSDYDRSAPPPSRSGYDRQPQQQQPQRYYGGDQDAGHSSGPRQPPPAATGSASRYANPNRLAAGQQQQYTRRPSGDDRCGYDY